MKWQLIESGSHPGKYNMAFDISLVEKAADEEAFLRFYRWKPYCISLGANQKENIINLSKAGEDNIDVVTRPTGGRAILHAEELTYSVVYPVDNSNSVRKVYDEINYALVNGLNIYDEELSTIETETVQPDFRNLYKQVKGEVCFSASAKSEIKYDGRKLVGSAQRKYGKYVLQHGSILVGKFHRNIIDYLNISNKEKEDILIGLENKTIELESILSKKINYEKLIKSLTKGFEDYFDIKFLNSITGKKELIYSA